MTSNGDRLEAVLRQAFRHPLRCRIFCLMLESRDLLSPGEAADALERPVSQVSYHFRCLAQAKLITLEQEEEVSGSIRHLYKASAEAAANPWVRTVVQWPYLPSELS